MAAFSSSSIAAPPRSHPLLRPQAASWGLSPPKSVSFSHLRSSSSSVSRPSVVCMAKPETVEKVCTIVKKQLALDDNQVLNGESKLTALGADSLDTVEIVMGLEEEFGITVEEESAQNIATIEDAADMIEKLVAKNNP